MPFTGGIESIANATLLFSVLAAIGYAFSISMPPSLRGPIVKTLAIGLLAVLAFDRDAPLLLVAALGLSAASDAFSSQLNVKMSAVGFLAAVGAFMVFGLLFITHGRLDLLTLEPSRAVLGTVLILLFSGAMAWTWRQLNHTRRLPVLVYALALLVMALPALVTTPVIIAGSVLVIGSGAACLLAKSGVEEGASQQPFWPYAIWALRYTGHLLITLGSVA